MDITLVFEVGTTILALIVGLFIVRGTKQPTRVAPIPVREERVPVSRRRSL